MKKRPRAETLVAGVDEAGRGPLAGPVVAAAVILDGTAIDGLGDSKRLAVSARERLDRLIRCGALSWSVGMASAAEIDVLNIHHATLLAMRRAVLSLRVLPSLVLVDGKFTPVLPMAARAEVGGDARIASIAAASIVAKQARDRLMVHLHRRFPQYGFDAHKGYPTAAHREAIRLHGIADCHRRSFAPVRESMVRGKA